MRVDRVTSMPEGTDTAGGKRRPAGPRSRSGLTLLAVFAVACIGAAVVGRLYFDSQRALIIAQKSAELTAIRDLKIDQIVQWRDGLLSDGKVAVNDPTVRPDIAAWTADPNDLTATDALRAWMDAVVENRGYSNGLLLAPGESRWIATTGGSAPSPKDLTDAAPAFRSTDAMLTDLFADSQTGVPGLHVVAPLRGGGPATLAVLLLHGDPSRFLYPLLQGWPTPSPTSETLLLRSDGDSVLYLNELRFRKDTALKMRLPTSRTTLLAVQALTGVPRVVEGIDYRGEPVVGAVGQVPGTPWFIVAKVDQAEAYAAVYQTQRLTLMAFGLFVVAIGLGLAVAWRQRAAAFYRQRMEAEHAARLLAQQYDYVTRYANDVVLLADAELRIVQVNDRATAVYGYTREELLAMTLPDLGDPASREETQANARIVKEQGSRLYEARQMRKDGTALDMEVSARAIESDGRTMYLSILRDITERKQAEDEILRLNAGLEQRVQERTEELGSANEELGSANEELGSANEELASANEELIDMNVKLEEATRAKSDFLAAMSHELRTPLNSIIGFSGTMLQGLAGDLNSEQNKQLGMINNSGRHLLELINEILDMAKIESGQNKPTFRKLDVGSAAREMFDTVRPMAEAKGLDMRWTCPEDMRPVRTDGLCVNQILLNLLGNAVKFTQRGYISATVSQDGSGAAVAIEDSGCGISAEYLEHIFEDFYQVVPHSSAEGEGTGLGLAVSRRLAESIGARIEAASEPGRGSVFTLRIPERPR